MSGHVSKASDVYAFGILLHELISGQRAYAGAPVQAAGTGQQTQPAPTADNKKHEY